MPSRSVPRLASLAVTFILAALGATWVHSLRVPATEGSFGEILNPDDPADQWRYGPAPHVRLLLIWRTTPYGSSRWGSQESRCLRLAFVVTDSNGRYRAAAWWRKPSWPPRRVDEPVISAYESGFDRPLWIGDKHPAPYAFTSVGARSLPEKDPLPADLRVTPEQMTGCREPPVIVTQAEAL